MVRFRAVVGAAGWLTVKLWGLIKQTNQLTATSGSSHRAQHAAGLHAPAVTTTVPALGELSLDPFVAAATDPRLLHRSQGCQSLFEDRPRPVRFFVFNDPKLRPTFGGRQLAGGADQIEFPSHTLDAECCHHVLQMADHQRVFGAVDAFHCSSRSVSCCAAAPTR